MRARWAAALVTAAAIALGGAASAASATDPIALGAGFVSDDAGVLSPSDAERVEERLSVLADESPVDLWVVYVDTFSSPTDAAEWAADTAEQNGLGPNQYLLAVAVESRQYYLSADSSGPVPFDEVTAIEQDRIQPALRQDDWAGAAIAAADGLSEATGGGASGGAGIGGIVVAVLVVAAIAVVIVLVVRARRRAARTGNATGAGPQEVALEELERRAASALVQTDDAIRTSEQELGFATAQFGEAAAAEFAAALADARAQLNRAFTLQQRLDDAEPDTEEQVRSWYAEILQLCEQANAGLDDKAADFDELRELEKNAPEAFARLQAERVRVADDLDAATARLESLRASYAPEALATIADNPDQARERIAFADEQLRAAEAAIGAGDGGGAAVSLRAAEEAVGQAALLEAAIGTLGKDLAEGETSAAALLADLETDIVAALALPDADGRIAGAVAAARQQIDSARSHLAGPLKRPLVALRGLESANEQIDALVQGVRDAQARDQRARQMVGQLILQAQAQVSTAEDYVTARRGAIGAEARTRLAEAGASLVQAQQLQQSAPEQAMQHAQRANQLAGQAIQAAQRDVGGFGGGYGGTPGGGPRGGDSMLGAVLGGIVINSLLGGGGRSSGAGGFGGGFGGFGGGGRRGGRSSGSFGGGGTRSRRGGGRF